MLSLAESIISRKRHMAEAYIVRTVTNAVYIDNSKISNVETKIDKGMSYRIIDDNRMGKASVTINGSEDIEHCISMAEQGARFSPPNKDLNGFPVPEKKKLVPKGIWDERIENIDAKELMDIAYSVIHACSAEIPRGLLRVSTIESAVANSNGVSVEHHSTMLYGHFTSMIRSEHPGEGIETVFGNSLSIDTEKIGSSLNEKAISASAARPFKGRKELTMILPPSEMGDMLMSSAGSYLNGENMKYGRSPWKDSIGQQVGSDTLTITDDPLTSGPLCSSFDDEGTPSSQKILVEKGVLKDSLRDSFIGNSTGNGMRRNSTESQGIYENAVSIRPMNLVVSPGKYSVDDIISETDNGILVERFAWPEADPLTGRFGLEVRSGRLIENGEMKGTINCALLMGNMMNALRNVNMIGKDLTNMGCVSVPTISFSGTELIGN